MSDLLNTSAEYGLRGDLDGMRLQGEIRIVDGIITDAGELKIRENEKIIDARGAVVTPDLLDNNCLIVTFTF